MIHVPCKSAPRLSYLPRSFYILFNLNTSRNAHYDLSTYLPFWSYHLGRLRGKILLTSVKSPSSFVTVPWREAHIGKISELVKRKTVKYLLKRKTSIQVQKALIMLSAWSMGFLPMTQMGVNWQERGWEIFAKKCISFACREEKAAALATVLLESAQGNRDSLLLSSRH